MATVDLNGSGYWSLEAICLRYQDYARELGVSDPLSLAPKTVVEGQTNWIYPVIEQILDGAQTSDAACIQIAVELVCTDARFKFGKIFKDRAANLLGQAALSHAQEDRLRARIIEMLRSGFVPPEFKRYARLLSKLGLGGYRDELERIVPAGPRIAWYQKYFLAVGDQPGSKAR